MAAASGSARSSSSHSARRPLTNVAIFAIVLSILIVAQVAALVYLGGQGGNPTTTKSGCLFWIFGCSSTTTSDANAQAPAQLATLLGYVFAISDVLVFALFVVLALRSRSGVGRSGRRSRQLATR